MHPDNKAADRPEHAILVAPNVPEPLAPGYPPDRVCGDQQVDEGDRADKGRIDAEDQSDCEHRFDQAGDVHPERRWLELRGDEKSKRLRNEEFGVDMRDEKQPANQTQDVEFIDEIEVLQKAGHCTPPYSCRTS